MFFNLLSPHSFCFSLAALFQGVQLRGLRGFHSSFSCSQWEIQSSSLLEPSGISRFSNSGCSHWELALMACLCCLSFIKHQQKGRKIKSRRKTWNAHSQGRVGDRKEQQHPHNEAALISHGLADKLCILKPNTQENEQSFNQSHPPVLPHTGIKPQEFSFGSGLCRTRVASRIFSWRSPDING